MFHSTQSSPRTHRHGAHRTSVVLHKNILASIAVGTACIALSAATTLAAPQPATRPLAHTTPHAAYKNGDVIVRMKDATVKKLYAESLKEIGATHTQDAVTHTTHNKILATLKAAAKTDDVRLVHAFDNLNIAVITANQTNTDTLIARLAADDAIAYAEPNYIKTFFFSPNDPYFTYGYQWYYTQSTDRDIDGTEMWDSESSAATPTTVAFIDSGIMHDNAELRSNLWTATGCDPTTDATCPKYGWDFADGDNDPYDTFADPDFRGHGSMVASIFSATTNNGIGLAGMSRYNNGRIMSLRFDLTLAKELEALAFAKARGVRVINASFGGGAYSQAEHDAIANFNGIVVTAAGNGGDDKIGDSIDAAPQYPCSYNLANIICVGATDKNDNLATFSNYGVASVDIAAPGVDIVGTIENDTYYTGSGTSYATAFVSGAVATLWGHNPSASIATVRNTILAGSDHLASLSDTVTCSRRLNLNTALRAFQTNSIPAENCRTTFAPVYRFWSDTKQGHFYTASTIERDYIIASYPVWHYEGMAFSAFAQHVADTTPIYRFWSNEKQHHFYTASTAERDYVMTHYSANTWNYEGIAYYAYTSATTDSTPVYRFWSDTKQGHFYTASAVERDSIIATYPDDVWRYEGIGWYIPQ